MASINSLCDARSRRLQETRVELVRPMLYIERLTVVTDAREGRES